MKNLIIILIPFLFGCKAIPKKASILCISVNQGIERMQSETENLIITLGDVERGILDEKWEDIYLKIEDKYREEKGLSSDTILSQNQRIDIATGAVSVREDLLKAISDKENELIAQTRKNTQKVIDINTKVQNYLLSIENYENATDRISKLTEEIAGFNPKSILGTIDRSVQSSINNSLTN